jgi:hypothetical protein
VVLDVEDVDVAAEVVVAVVVVVVKKRTNGNDKQISIVGVY